MQNPTSAEILVVMGDVHANLPLALRGLERIEEECGQAIAQVFSVGDLGLFLDPLDWNFLSGPKKHRHPERTPAIVEAWNAWRWPLAMIGGNHEPNFAEAPDLLQAGGARVSARSSGRSASAPHPRLAQRTGRGACEFPDPSRESSGGDPSASVCLLRPSPSSRSLPAGGERMPGPQHHPGPGTLRQGEHSTGLGVGLSVGSHHMLALRAWLLAAAPSRRWERVIAGAELVAGGSVE